MTTQADEKEPRWAEKLANIAKPRPEQRKSKA
jgi:hypothetical protein